MIKLSGVKWTPLLTAAAALILVQSILDPVQLLGQRRSIEDLQGRCPILMKVIKRTRLMNSREIVIVQLLLMRQTNYREP
jgi:hypothetical protein